MGNHKITRNNRWWTNSREVAGRTRGQEGTDRTAGIVEGLWRQVRRDGRVQAVDVAGPALDEEGDGMEWRDWDAWDDVTGTRLDPGMVRTARQEEMDEYRKHGVYFKVPKEQCRQRTGKEPIPVRWIDINKGDEENPEYRSRLVAKEIKRDQRDDMFADTPPLEALKILVSLAMTEGIGYERGKEQQGMKTGIHR